MGAGAISGEARRQRNTSSPGFGSGGKPITHLQCLLARAELFEVDDEPLVVVGAAVLDSEGVRPALAVGPCVCVAQQQ